MPAHAPGKKQPMTKLRAWWWHRQGLDGRLSGAAAAKVLEDTGWTRSLGGVGPYVTLFSRAGIGRAAADAAVKNLEIHELPSARNCTYVLPSRDFALGLRAGASFANGEEKLAVRLGVAEAELEKLRAGILDVLGKGPLDPAELREATGGLVRNLGEEGKKKGLSTTLPAALGRLQAEGEIRRTPVNGRLDQQRYRYSLWRPHPLKGFSLTPEEVNVELARRYFHWAGPATCQEFQDFSGLGAKAARAAMDALKLIPIATGGESRMSAEDRGALADFEPPGEPQYALLTSLDGLGLFRRNLASLLGEEDQHRASGEKGLKDWESHPILDRGRWIGSWEYDPGAKAVVWAVWVKKDKALEAAVRRTEEFIQRELGDARAYSMDNPKSRAVRIAKLRKGY
jgi:hypothetical protein